MSIAAPPAPPAEPARAGSPGPRLLAVDALRGVAVILMIEQHLGAWLWKVPAGTRVWDHPVLVGINALGGGAAPAFITVAGVGTALFVASRQRPDRAMLVRGLVVMGFGQWSPLKPNDSADNKRLNRRVEIFVSDPVKQ